MGHYCTTILLGAFLLFQVQPQIARFILPWFGGGAAVWSTCMVFFQVMLLGGYAYAHLLTSRGNRRTQAMVHAALLIASLAFLPVIPAEHWKPTDSGDPTWHILQLLGATVGVPYLLLAASGPLLQSWFAHEFRGASPYRLYALSNVGSLVALLSFPFVFEPNFTLGLQADMWVGLYIGYAILCIWCALRVALHRSSRAAGPDTDAAPRRSTDELILTATAAIRASAPRITERLAWVALAMLPSVMLLAVTNTICQDLAVVPFLWVMPLAVYLLSFILTFDHARWYQRSWMAPLLGGLALLLMLASPSIWFVHSVTTMVGTNIACLFFCGMVCHGELVRHKPAPTFLTGFYLSIALGGAAGGAFVALLAPILFDTYLEFEIGLIACMVAAVMAMRQLPVTPTSFGRLLKFTTRGMLPAALLIGTITAILLRGQGDTASSTQSRNFYGRLTVSQQMYMVQRQGRILPLAITALTHGQTVHGRQVKGQGAQANQGMSYYWPTSGVAYALTRHPAAATRPLRVGVIGLGAGTLAHYARPGDHYTFYEINPEIERVAETDFTYLADARARGAEVDVRIGDARILLERELTNDTVTNYDVLVLDAFSSDAIPVHLLTQEANRTYWRHLADDGILAAHISNRHLDLAPVIRGLAADSGKDCRFILAQHDDIAGTVEAQWVLVTGNDELLQQPALQLSTPRRAAASLLWTDSFSSLWHALR